MGMEPGSRALALHCRHEFNVQHCKTSKQVNKEAKKQMWVKEEEWTHLSILLRRCKVLCDVWSPLCLLHLQSPSPFMCDTYMSTCTHACRSFLRSRKKRDVSKYTRANILYSGLFGLDPYSAFILWLIGWFSPLFNAFLIPPWNPDGKSWVLVLLLGAMWPRVQTVYGRGISWANSLNYPNLMLIDCIHRVKCHTVLSSIYNHYTVI